MKKFGITKMRQVVALAMAGMALLFGAAGVASAATNSGNLTITGTLTDTPPPASCSIVSMPTIDATYVIPYGGVSSYVKSSSMTLNCTSGLNYNLSVPFPLNPLTLNGVAEGMSAAVFSGTALANMVGGKNFVGTGGNDVIPLQITFRKNYGDAFASGDTGAVSGTVVLTITY